MRNRPRSGLALIIVAGVLGLLAALAMAFTTLAQLERRASRQRLYATKARLLARSGIEDALARLDAGQVPAYGGEDFNGDGLLTAGVETSAQVFQPAALNVGDCPVRHALRPSFFVKDSFGQPDPKTVGGRVRGYSGMLAGDRVAGGNVYTLKVEDESAKINVNGGFLDSGDRDNGGAGDGIPDHRDPDMRVNPSDPKDTGLGWNFQLARILGVLGNQPEVGILTLGTDVLANRPAGGYVSIADLQQRIGINNKDLSPYLTVSSWVDRSVIHPGGYGSEPDGNSTGFSTGGLKRARVPCALDEGGRPPVNLNVAPRSVLVALLTDLSAQSQAAGLPPAQVQPVADAMIAARPFATWSQFEAFCDGLVPATLSGSGYNNVWIEDWDYDPDLGGYYARFWAGGGCNLAVADLLKANFNPNTRSNKELPDQHLRKWVDKTDLTTWSTEGSLHPTGDYLVSVAARLTGRDGRVLAEATLRTSVRAFSLVRQTSQADFLAGRMPDGTPQSCLSLASASPPPPIPVLRMAGAGASWNAGGGGQGLGAMTCPCAPMAPASRVDGYIALATVELPHDNPSYPGARLCFLNHFDDGWDADFSVGGAPAREAGIDGADAELQTATTQDVWPTAGIEPNTLYPDGVHIQKARAPSYAAVGNLPPATVTSGIVSNHGVLSYWVKRCLDKGLATNSGYVDSYDVSCVRGSGFNQVGTVNQVLVIGSGLSGWGLVVENRAVSGDAGSERRQLVNAETLSQPFQCVRLPGLRWRLVTACFDTGSVTQDLDVRLDHRGVQPTQGKGGLYADPFAVTQTSDLLQDAPLLALGRAGRNNHVIDEFAVLDFGADATAAFGNSDLWAGFRYADGRYYKGKDAAFLSAPMELDLSPAPVRLLRAWWTAYLPSESHRELYTTWLTGGDDVFTEDPRLPDPVLAGRCRVDVDLLDASSGTLTGPALQALSQGGAIGRTLPAFRYRVRLGVDLADPANKPVLESPVFDDITFAWQPATGPRITGWERP